MLCWPTGHATQSAAGHDMNKLSSSTSMWSGNGDGVVYLTPRDNLPALVQARPIWCQGERAKTLNTGPARPYQTLSPFTVTITVTATTGSGLRDTLGLIDFTN